MLAHLKSREPMHCNVLDLNFEGDSASHYGIDVLRQDL